MINIKSIIDEQKIMTLLEEHSKPDVTRIEEVLDKAVEKKGLNLDEVATLLQIEDEEHLNRLFETAYEVKREIYGNRIVIFAPLYISNECANVCDYCGFRADNKELHRKTLSHQEIKDETEILIESGHKRLLLVYGEHPRFDGRCIAETVKAVYSVTDNNNSIRRINVNSAPLSVEDFKIVKESGIGTYQCFQETYHRSTYEKVHLKGKKANYENRLTVHDKAFEAGIDDLGLGVLFGLYDWKFETLALLQHANYLETTYGVGPHTISFPRLEPALNAPLSEKPTDMVDNIALKKIVAIVRLAIPYTGLILTTRETKGLRNELLKLGVSQISAGSRTYPGAYHDEKQNKPDMQQFTIGDTRSLDEVILDLAKQGFIPSFCTSCYRKGRTGHTFMEYAKPGNIHKFCAPNAVLTFMEYLTDYATPETKEEGLKLIEKELESLPDICFKDFLVKQTKRIIAGERDLIL